MSFKYNTDIAVELKHIKSDEDIKQLSNAIFPGTHCPLFGALMISSYIENMAVLIVGTEECTFYGKDFSHSRQKGKDRTYSLVIGKRDITFGLQDKLIKCIEDINRDVNPDSLLVISTCVTELIGEDVEAIIKSVDLPDLPLLCVKTEHFKCNSHIPGMRDTLHALSGVMKTCEVNPSVVNILGHRFDGFTDTELYKLLTKHGIGIHMSIPSKSSLEKIKTAPMAKLNIVTDFTAVKLAESMKSEFGTPYVVFEKYTNPDRIYDNYLLLEGLLDIDIKEEVTQLYKETQMKIENLKLKLEGQTFIYGNTPMKAFEFSSFLGQVGLEPVWIQKRELYDDDFEYLDEILTRGYNPKVSRIANIMPMRKVYDEKKPKYYIGHENPMELMKREIIQLTFDAEARGLGFELPLSILKKFKEVNKPTLDAMEVMGNKPMNVMKMMNLANKDPKAVGEMMKKMKDKGLEMPKGHAKMVETLRKDVK